MDRYALFGQPVSHSLSPLIHGLFALQFDQRLEYGLVNVGAAGFAGAVEAFFAEGGRGANVTVPHKQAAAALVAGLTPRAQMAAAVNTLRPSPDGLVGDNTDGTGLLRDLRDNLGIGLRDARVLVIGAGGAVRGILGPLLTEGPASLCIANRTLSTAEALATGFRGLGPVEARSLDELDRGHWDLMINGTSAGLAGGLPDLPRTLPARCAVAYDLSYSGHADTAFQAWAREAGTARSFQGLGMLVEQAAESFFLWRGLRPATGNVIEALRRGSGSGS
ncbi:MAG: shikimate dehydrogenase [Steroidobacteraceae bacterium]